MGGFDVLRYWHPIIVSHFIVAWSAGLHRAFPFLSVDKQQSYSLRSAHAIGIRLLHRLS
jgi:hypothetical protein